MIPEIEEFARTLVESVRDASIQSSDMTLESSAACPVAKRWRLAISQRDQKALARVAIPDIVDETLFYLLNAIDEGVLHVTFVSKNGKSVDLTAQGLGELAGWYMGSGGWRKMYSHERVVDDFADLGGGRSS